MRGSTFVFRSLPLTVMETCAIDPPLTKGAHSLATWLERHKRNLPAAVRPHALTGLRRFGHAVVRANTGGGVAVESSDVVRHPGARGRRLDKGANPGATCAPVRTDRRRRLRR